MWLAALGQGLAPASQRFYELRSPDVSSSTWCVHNDNDDDENNDDNDDDRQPVLVIICQLQSFALQVVWPYLAGEVIVQNYNAVLSLARLYAVCACSDECKCNCIPSS